MIANVMTALGDSLIVLLQVVVAVSFLFVLNVVAYAVYAGLRRWRQRRRLQPGAIVRIEMPGAVRERIHGEYVTGDAEA